MSSKKSGCGCLSLGGLIITIAIGGIGGYAYKQGWHQFLTNRNLTPLTGAEVIPDETLMTGFVTTDRKNWQQIDKLGIAPAEGLIKQITTDLDRELAASNLDYQKDIEPWLGNGMFAMVPHNQDILEPNLLVVLGIKNPLKAYSFFKKIKAESADNLKTVKYKGIEINTIQEKSGDRKNIAILGNKIVISDEILGIKQAIDTYKGEPSFASVTQNQQVLKQPFKLKNKLIKLYFTDYDRLYKAFNSSPTQNNIANLQPIKSVAIGIGTEEKQLSIQNFTAFKEHIPLPTSKPITDKIASQYPEQTIALIHSKGINTFWTTLVSIGEQDRDLKRALNGMRTSTKWVTGLDLDRDIFSWMDGEFGVGIIPTQAAIIPELNLKLGTAIILQTSDRNTAQNTLKVIADKIKQQTGINPKTKQLNKETVTQWDIPYSDLDVSYGWLNKNSLLLTVGNNAFDSMNNNSQSSLQKNEKFQQFVKKLPKDNLSYFYLDVAKIITTVKQIPELPIDNNSEFMVILDSVKGIGAASNMTDKNITKTDFVVLFK